LRRRRNRLIFERGQAPDAFSGVGKIDHITVRAFFIHGKEATARAAPSSSGPLLKKRRNDFYFQSFYLNKPLADLRHQTQRCIKDI
jgi:hypothetical protein